MSLQKGKKRSPSFFKNSFLFLGFLGILWNQVDSGISVSRNASLKPGSSSFSHNTKESTLVKSKPARLAGQIHAGSFNSKDLLSSYFEFSLSSSYVWGEKERIEFFLTYGKVRAAQHAKAFQDGSLFQVGLRGKREIQWSSWKGFWEGSLLGGYVSYKSHFWNAAPQDSEISKKGLSLQGKGKVGFCLFILDGIQFSPFLQLEYLTFLLADSLGKGEEFLSKDDLVYFKNRLEERVGLQLISQFSSSNKGEEAELSVQIEAGFFATQLPGESLQDFDFRFPVMLLKAGEASPFLAGYGFFFQSHYLLSAGDWLDVFFKGIYSFPLWPVSSSSIAGEIGVVWHL